MTTFLFIAVVLAWFAYELWTAPLCDDLEPNEVSLWKSLREDDNV